MQTILQSINDRTKWTLGIYFPQTALSPSKEWQKTINCICELEQGKAFTVHDVCVRLTSKVLTKIKLYWSDWEGERAAAYWKAHPNERQSIDEQIDADTDEHSALQSKIQQLQEEQAALTGIFKGKKKKQLAQQIKDIENQQKKLRANIDTLRQKLNTYPPDHM